MAFRNQFNYEKNYKLITPKIDEKIIQRKKFQFNKTKLKYEVVDAEKFNLAEFIQSFKASCNLKMLIDKYNHVQDFALAFGVPAGKLDTTTNVVKTDDDLPNNIAEAFEMTQRVDAAFNKMDPALKNGASTVYEFLTSLNNDTIKNYIDAKLSTLIKPKEVKNNG